MQSMPQSFRALADRVGEVADLLSHAQADLPNWWKGPAAKQAAASLGRAAAEAREFHDSAMGAATAVSRCAQVVAEQQNQMMNVPDVQEPGVSAVVQRPTTPFEALEAARQDAAYQAAHEQAVQVVNGIAAQYVETRSQLSNVGFKFGENFTLAESSSTSWTAKENAANSYSKFTAEQDSIKQTRETFPGSIHPPSLARARSRYVPLESSSTPAVPLTSVVNLHSDQNSHEPADFKPFKSITDDPLVEKQTFQEDLTTIQYPTNEIKNRLNDPPWPTEEPALAIPVSQYTSTAKPKLAAVENEGLSEEYKNVRTHENNYRSRTEPIDHSTHTFHDKKSLNITEAISPNTAASKDLPPTPADATHQPGPEDGGFDNPAIIPPYSSLGSVHRTREERNPRPAYLKEQKSAWLPETIAAPADGVLDPGWFEQS